MWLQLTGNKGRYTAGQGGGTKGLCIKGLISKDLITKGLILKGLSDKKLNTTIYAKTAKGRHTQKKSHKIGPLTGEKSKITLLFHKRNKLTIKIWTPKV